MQHFQGITVLVEQRRRELIGDAERLNRRHDGRRQRRRKNLRAPFPWFRRPAHIRREIVSQLSHELRTPLTTIHGYASSLLQPDVEWDAASQERFLTTIARESARMSRLVSDLLEPSAPTSGIQGLRCDWFDLSGLLASVVSCVGEPPNVEWSCDPGLTLIWGNQDRIEQALVNLVENALRHTPLGTPVRIQASRADQPGMVTIRVVDRGPGLPAGQADRLFGAYTKGADGPGLGLGLFIARRVVEAHGGAVSLETVPVGTCFLVTLPINPNDGSGGAAQPRMVEERV